MFCRTGRLVTVHNRDHFFDQNQECSCIDKDIDVYKLVAAVVHHPKNSRHLQTSNSVNSFGFETEFNHSIGKYHEHKRRGHHVYIHINEESDDTLKFSWEYYLVTVLISNS